VEDGNGVTKEIIPFNLEELLNKEGLAETLLKPDLPEPG